jgi:hypothetical protein
MKFTIERSTWRCGGFGLKGVTQHGNNYTKLLDKEGFRCCLGSVCSQLGVPDTALLDIAYPRQLNDFKELVSILRTERPSYAINSELADHAIDINDSYISFAVREEKLITLFAEYGHELEFVGVFTHDKPNPSTTNESSCANQSSND